MSALMTQEELYHFENVIYLPMVLTVLHKDLQLINGGEFKIKGPYQQIINQAIKCVEAEALGSRQYIKNNNMKLVKGQQDDFMTEYIFFHKGYEQKRKYMNLRLRNRTEELIRVYLSQGMAIKHT